MQKSRTAAPCGRDGFSSAGLRVVVGRHARLRPGWGRALLSRLEATHIEFRFFFFFFLSRFLLRPRAVYAAQPLQNRSAVCVATNQPVYRSIDELID